ncbi:MAG: hypothetical protein KGZ68_17765 [Dechloromonas sp.]|nr:hypothetical protein [Dechloromonas sp.]
MSTQSVADHQPIRSASVMDAGGCDITQPMPAAQSLGSQLEAMRRDWLEVARYKITLSRDGDWNDQSVVAEWLPYAEAVQRRDELNKALLVKQGGVHRWAQASYGIALHTPPVTKGNKASVGDLLLHERVVPHGTFSLSGTYVVRQFLIAAEVTSVAAGGRIVGYRDRDGEHIQTPTRPHIVSSSFIDVPGVLANIVANEKARGHWAAEFCSLKAVEPILVRHQRLQAPLLPI